MIYHFIGYDHTHCTMFLAAGGSTYYTKWELYACKGYHGIIFLIGWHFLGLLLTRFQSLGLVVNLFIISLVLVQDWCFQTIIATNMFHTRSVASKDHWMCETKIKNLDLIYHMSVRTWLVRYYESWAQWDQKIDLKVVHLQVKVSLSFLWETWESNWSVYIHMGYWLNVRLDLTAKSLFFIYTVHLAGDGPEYQIVSLLYILNLHPFSRTTILSLRSNIAG